MAEKDDKPLDVNLELPSFGLRRKRKDKKADEDAEPPADTAADEKPRAATEAVQPTAPVTSAPPTPAAAAPEAAPESSRFAPPVAPATPAAPAAPARHAAPAAPAAPATPATQAAPTAPLTPPTQPIAEPAPQLAPELDEAAVEAESAPAPPRFERARLPKLAAPKVGARKAAAFTGVLVGLLACGATWLGLQGCEAIRGTSSCGGPGFLLLLVILVLLVVIGAAMLKLLRVADHAATSFLAVGLLAMLVLLFLTSWIFEWWIVLIITPLAAGTFVLAHWVTSHAGND